MDDTPTPVPPAKPELEIAPLPPRKKRRGRMKRPLKKPARVKAPPMCAGMTNFNCADGCTPSSCVISHRGYCAHPYKGGLQRLDQNDLACIARLNDAKQFLGARRG